MSSGAIPISRISVSSTKWMIIVADILVGGIAILVVTAIRSGGPDDWLASASLMIFGAFWMTRARLYSIRFITRRSEEIRRIVRACAQAAGTTGLVSFFLRWDVSRLCLLAVVGITTIALLTEREMVRRIMNRRRRNGTMRRPVLIIGDNSEGRELESMFATDLNLGYEVCATVATAHKPKRSELVADVFTQIERTGATGVVIAATAISSAQMNRLVRDLLDAGIHVELSSSLADIEPHRLTVRPLGRYPVVYVEAVARQGWRAAAKRLFDFSLSLLVVALGAPVFAIIALAIKIDSEGPVFFSQARLGKDGQTFRVLKFRTMVVDAEERKAELESANEGAGPLFKMKYDPRVTRLGRTLRATSLDEIPQLLNVLRGDMSLVGPRPALESETIAWGDDLFGRLRVRPGITGMWQVSGRSGTTFEEYTRLDLFYVDNWSLVVDLSILMRTIPAILKSDGAY